MDHHRTASISEAAAIADALGYRNSKGGLILVTSLGIQALRNPKSIGAHKVAGRWHVDMCCHFFEWLNSFESNEFAAFSYVGIHIDTMIETARAKIEADPPRIVGARIHNE